MIINNTVAGVSDNADKFRKKLRFRLGISILIALTGLAAAILILTLNRGFDGLMVDNHQLSFLNGYFWGVSLGLTGAGLATVGRMIYYLKNKKAFAKRMLLETDERNRYISLKAWSWTGYLMIYAMLVGSIIVGRFSFEATLALICMIFVCVFIYGVSYVIIKRSN
jgi:hypothetical protein